MRLVDKTSRINRRRFLGTSVGTAALLATAPILPHAALAAITLQTVPATAVPTLVRMARDLYPHDRIADNAYAIAVGSIDSQLAADPAKKTILADGLGNLDVAARKLHGRSYVAIASEANRVAVLTSIEDTVFFKTMRASMITALYNQEDLWPKFGYEGSSAEKGGYLHRGFNDLDWLQA